MATFVVGTGSVHASAALCDYLGGRLAEGDTVRAAAWAGDPGAGGDPARERQQKRDRDAADALNGVRSRLGVRASVETCRLDGPDADGAADALRAMAARIGADELVVAAGAGTDGGLDPADAAALIADAGRPVVAVPVG